MKGAIGGFEPGASSTFHYDVLPEHLRKHYAAIRKAMIGYESSVRIGKELTADECFGLVEAVLYDNPQIFWMNTGCGCSIGKGSTTISFMKNRFGKDRERLKRIIVANAEEIYRKHVEGLRDASGIELAVHDVLAAKVSYDGTDKESSHCLVGPLVEKKGVCEGISKAAAFLLNAFGVESAVVTGRSVQDGEPHAWNAVRLGREWYNTDVTFDLRKGAGSGTRFYLDMDDAMAGRTHELRHAGRCRSRRQNHYIRNGTYFGTAEEASRYISGCDPPLSDGKDLYDVYIEEDCDGREVMRALTRRYAGQPVTITLASSGGRFLASVRRRRDGQEGEVRQAFPDDRQGGSGREPAEAVQRDDGPQVRRKGREHGMVSEPVRARGPLRGRIGKDEGRREDGGRGIGQDHAGPGEAQLVPRRHRRRWARQA